MYNRNILVLALLSLVFILALSIFVYAAGSSTTSSRASGIIAEDDTKLNQTKNASQKITDCNSPENRRKRIKCRLSENATEEEIDYEKRVPEACATLRNPTSCIALYKRVQTNKCYDLDGQQKDRCFKRTINMAWAKFSDLPSVEKAQKARNYILLLLYDLEERIEEAYKEGKITLDTSSEIIDLITQIKQDIFI